MAIKLKILTHLYDIVISETSLYMMSGGRDARFGFEFKHYLVPKVQLQTAVLAYMWSTRLCSTAQLHNYS